MIAPKTPRLLVGESFAMVRLRNVIGCAAKGRLSVLITGERGSGKELVAQAIHAESACSGSPFMALNCAAISESLQDSELFGHEKGAFTGADHARTGLLDAAGEGTVFLDEVGDMAPGVQAKLLRVLQERTLRPVLGRAERRFGARIIAALNRSPQELIAEKRLREDFYDRLNVFPIEVPPLRDRLEDIPLLVSWFLQRALEDGVAGLEALPPIQPEAVALLSRWTWPGNVRELFSVVLRLAASHRTGILAEHVMAVLGPLIARAGIADLAEHEKHLPELERDFYMQALTRYLKRSDGSMRRAAKLAGIDGERFRRLCRKFGVRMGE